MQTVLIVIGEFIAVLTLSYFGVLAVRHLGERHEVFDMPNERSSHSGPVPRGGGVTIVILTILAVWLYNYRQAAISWRFLIAYTVGATLIVAISSIDDIRSQPAWLRFAVQGLAAIIVICGSGYFRLSSLSGAAGACITFFWIVGLTNAYNFMDGIDGIAAGQALVASLGWSAVGYLSGHGFIMFFGLMLAASSLGFLLHNWPPATIFMGDVGAAFLGYTFAVVPLILGSGGGFQARALTPFIAGIILVWPFVFDSTFTLLRRLRFGENVFKAHRSHLYQRLVILGYTHQTVSLIYVGLAVIGVALAILGLRQNATLLLLVIISILCLTLWRLVTRCEHKAGSNAMH